MQVGHCTSATGVSVDIKEACTLIFLFSALAYCSIFFLSGRLSFLFCGTAIWLIHCSLGLYKSLGICSDFSSLSGCPHFALHGWNVFEVFFHPGFKFMLRIVQTVGFLAICSCLLQCPLLFFFLLMSQLTKNMSMYCIAVLHVEEKLCWSTGPSPLCSSL